MGRACIVETSARTWSGDRWTGSGGAVQQATDHWGTLVLIVGPSGAGKDSVMRAVAERIAIVPVEAVGGRHLLFPRRVVTRPHAHAGEDCILMSVEAFDSAAAAGDFLLAWSAHGLRYGIPLAVRDDLADGRTVVINVSRGVITTAQAICPRTSVVHITAAPDVLAARIAARGRETVEDIRGRLSREAPLPVCRGGVVEIRNEGSIAEAADALLAHLMSLSPDRQREPGL